MQSYLEHKCISFIGLPAFVVLVHCYNQIHSAFSSGDPLSLGNFDFRELLAEDERAFFISSKQL